MTMRRLSLAATLALTLAAGTARADDDDPCAALAVPGAAAAATDGAADRAAVQAGLRAVFPADPGLSDGIVGPVTVDALGALCRRVPLADGTDPVSGTLDVARTYAALSQALPGWPARLADRALLAADGFNRGVVRLAGPPGTTAARLAQAAPGACVGTGSADLGLGADGASAVRAGLAALLAADPGLGTGDAPPDPEGDLGAALARTCAAYPADTLAGLAAELDRLGALAAAVPGAVATLGSPGFADWLGESPAARLGRLVATVPAVVALLADFAADGGPAPAVASVAPDCSAPDAGGHPTWFALDPADLEALAARAALEAALAPVAAERFADREALLAAVNAVLGVSPPDCAALRVAAAVDRHKAGGTLYGLDAEQLSGLALSPDFKDVLPALAPLAEIESPSREALSDGIEAAVADALAAAMGKAAAAAAEAAAAAAEDVSPSPDSPAPGIPAAEGERAEEFAITDASLFILQAEIEDPAILEAIAATPFKPLPSRDLVRSDMALALRPVVAAAAEAAAAARLESVLPAVEMHWRLHPAVIAELAADPAFAAVAPEALDAVGTLAGIAYPERRLFERALASLDAPVGDAARGAVLDIATKRVEQPYARRRVGPIAADCGCNVARRENAQVYAFYPFWAFPDADAAEPPRVDFDIVGRIAFEGLEIDGRGMLVYGAQWHDAAASFTASAHRHEVEVDLAIRLRGWRGWDEDETRLAAAAVVDALTRPVPEATLVTSPGPLGWLDRYLDRRPDGVTLIVEDYSGVPGAPRADRLVELVRMIAAGLGTDRRTINLAFDIPLLDPATADAPLFQDLRSLVTDTAEPGDRLVENLLVFLERPTTRSKKILRARLEGSFKGEERIRVLRSIIPVVPPGANAPLAPQQSDGVVAATVTSAAHSYGQFFDDLVYFQDNFNGIGFWPAPAAGATLPDGTPDRLGELVAERYYAWEPGLVPAAWEGPARAVLDGACAVVCPNRIAFHIVGAATAGLIAALGVLSLYSGRARGLARRLLLLPLLLVGLLGLLVVTATCDVDSRAWSLLALLALLALTGGSGLFHWYERRIDGPLP